MTSDEYEVFTREVWHGFLADATAEDIHRSLLTVNWDDADLEHPLWARILADPSVDRATALAAYWMSGPRWHKQHTAEEACQKDGAVSEEIEERYVAGFWTQAGIGYDPRCDDGQDWTEEYSDVTTVREIPAVMFEPVCGAVVPRPEDGWDDGLPHELAERLFAVEIAD